MTQFDSPNDICNRLTISRATFYRLAAAGAFPLIKIGRATRVRREDVEAWAASLSNGEGQRNA